MKMVRYRTGCPKGITDALSLEVLKARLDGALSLVEGGPACIRKIET